MASSQQNGFNLQQHVNNSKHHEEFRRSSPTPNKSVQSQQHPEAMNDPKHPEDSRMSSPEAKESVQTQHKSIPTDDFIHSENARMYLPEPKESIQTQQHQLPNDDSEHSRDVRISLQEPKESVQTQQQPLLNDNSEHPRDVRRSSSDLQLPGKPRSRAPSPICQCTEAPEECVRLCTSLTPRTSTESLDGLTLTQGQNGAADFLLSVEGLHVSADPMKRRSSLILQCTDAPEDYGSTNMTTLARDERQNEPSIYEQLRLSNPNKVYPMDSDPRGLVMIFNNEIFKHLQRRKWSDKDMRKLQETFTNLGFDVECEPNRTAKDTLDLLTSLAKRKSLESMSALVLIFLSHGGDDDVIYGSDGCDNAQGPVPGTFLKTSAVMESFTADKCPFMKRKPKLCITQCCRGKEDDRSKEEQRGTSCDCSALSKNTNMGNVYGQPLHDRPLPQRIAAMSDICYVHSTSKGFRSYRENDSGSPFVDTFTKCLEKYAATMEFKDIVLEVQNSMHDRHPLHGYMTLPDLCSQLTRKWYLNPPAMSPSVARFS